MPEPARRAALAVTVVACLGYLSLCWALRGFVADDSWISVRYAENLAAGAGPVWNPGGPRVEGYSNPALVGLEAVADAVGWSALGAARAVGVLSGLVCVLLVHRAGRAVVGPVAATAGAVLTAVSAPFALWAVGGLETTATAAVLTAGVLQLARPDGGRAGLAGALLAVLPWLRPEGLVVVLAVVVASEAPALLRGGHRRRAARRLALAGGVPVLSQVALEGLRLIVYGHALPNSVLYKSGTGETLGVALKFADESLPVLLLAGAGLLGLRHRGVLLAVPALVYGIGSVGTLDSANPFSRFFMPVWPQVALLAGVAVGAVATLAVRWVRSARARGAGHSVRRGAAAAAVLAGALALAAALVVPADVPRVSGWQERYMGCRAAARQEAARWLVDSTAPGTSFAVSDAGYVPARAGGRTAIDSFMLNDPLIQRTGPLSPRQRADVVHARRPDVLVLASRDPATFDPVYPTERALHEHPAAGDFRLRHVASGEPACGYHLLLLERSAPAGARVRASSRCTTCGSAAGGRPPRVDGRRLAVGGRG
ncbi:hypothetical protein [uncultured Cellulomonas sp.]|uniref:hypothetical protein n=1 Tax=uncultured Cellulomonas sp. TaxID=189682 RepID=UPI00262087C4|nr:hypothetical protein [uncultured Cellulomonas sp.]